MKRRYLFNVAAILLSCGICGCSGTNVGTEEVRRQESESVTQTGGDNPVDIVSDIATTQYFTKDEVAKEDIETIILAGINAPSAMNGQPWHFTVVTDATVLEKIAGDMKMGMPPAAAQGEDMPSPPTDEGDSNAPAPVTKAGIADAPVVIVLSCKDGSQLDAGLACQNMSVTAQLLGYGSKIISSPTMAVNGDNREEYGELLGIPEEQSAVAFLLVGVEDTSVDEEIDGYTGATERNSLEDMVTYVEGE